MTVMAYIQAHKMPPPASELNSRTKSYKFLGPLGALLITLGVPSTAYTLYFACSEHWVPATARHTMPKPNTGRLLQRMVAISV